MHTKRTKGVSEGLFVIKFWLARPKRDILLVQPKSIGLSTDSSPSDGVTAGDASDGAIARNTQTTNETLEEVPHACAETTGPCFFSGLECV